MATKTTQFPVSKTSRLSAEDLRSPTRSTQGSTTSQERIIVVSRRSDTVSLMPTGQVTSSRSVQFTPIIIRQVLPLWWKSARPQFVAINLMGMCVSLSTKMGTMMTRNFKKPQTSKSSSNFRVSSQSQVVQSTHSFLPENKSYRCLYSCGRFPGTPGNLQSRLSNLFVQLLGVWGLGFGVWGLGFG